MSAKQLHEPWRSFLRDVDRHLNRPTEVHCLGGFVVVEHYGLDRTTADIDIFECRGTNPVDLERLAGEGSPLHRKYGLYIDVVTVAIVPEEYETRLIDAFGENLNNLRIRVFDRHDLVLAKLSRNIDRDRDDVKALARGPGLDVKLLNARYREELRFKVLNPEREDQTMKLWTKMIEEVAAKQPPG